MTYLVFAAAVAAVTWPLPTNPAGLWPPHHDARVFTWVMTSVARRLTTDPVAFAHGNAFYPFGENLAYSELLLLPSLLGLPGFLWGNPILTYNLLLLGLWPLNGVAMAWAAHWLTGSRAGAWVAGAAFCVAPYFTEYYLEFQMLLAAAIPLTLLAWVRWLETLAGRWLALAVAALAAQALTSWYYGTILGLGLVTLTAGFLCLRWGGWPWRRVAGQLALAVLGLGVILTPFALPYLQVHAELGFERPLGEAAAHAADVATFVEPPARNWLYGLLGWAPTGHVAETSTFPGLVVLGLAAWSLLGPAGETRPAPGPAAVQRVLAALLVLALGLTAWSLAHPRGRYPLGPLVVRPRVRELLYVLGVLAVLLLAARGWAAWREGHPRPLGAGDWARLLWLLAAVFAALALGPVVRLARHEVGPGPYRDLYGLLPPLHALRVTARFAALTLAALALLAALGVRRLEARLAHRPARRRLLLGAMLVGLGLEYAVHPAAYQPVRWAPRPVDEVLRRDMRDVAVLEWPANVPAADAQAMVQSLWHGHRLVNGLSGFVPDLLADLSRLLSAPGAAGSLAQAGTLLRQLYPLEYLVARVEELPEPQRALWRELRRTPVPYLRFVGTFGTDDLYRVVPVPERGARIERWVAYDLLRHRPVLHVTLRPFADASGRDRWVEIRFNGRPVSRVALDGEASATVPLDGPWRRAAPNVVSLEYRQRLGWRDARYRIGTTGVLSPVDLHVRSAGALAGNTASLRVNGIEASPQRRGYNLVLLDPAGRVLAVAYFDTFADPEASARLARWVRALPAGTIVAGAVRDDASGRLTEDAVGALATLGVTGDLRGRFRWAHAFIGVKGAPPGSALEAWGPGAQELVVGRRAEELGFELARFELAARPAPAE